MWGKCLPLRKYSAKVHLPFCLLTLFPKTQNSLKGKCSERFSFHQPSVMRLVKVCPMEGSLACGSVMVQEIQNVSSELQATNPPLSTFYTVFRKPLWWSLGMGDLRTIWSERTNPEGERRELIRKTRELILLVLFFYIKHWFQFSKIWLFMAFNIKQKYVNKRYKRTELRLPSTVYWLSLKRSHCFSQSEQVIMLMIRHHTS